MAIMTGNRRRMTAESATESINTILPEELIIVVLSMIGLSNPLQLRCVCKWWKAMVVDSQFVENYFHKSFTDIIDLTSTAMEHVESFESHNIYVPDDRQEDDGDDDDGDEEEEEEEAAAKQSLMNKVAQLDNLLVILKSMKGNLKTMKVDMLALMNRMKCFESFLKIYLKSAASSSSSV